MAMIPFLMCLLLVLWLPGTSLSATSITQYGITWTFNADYTTGQFANGDYWVVDPGSGVVITSITNTFHPAADWSTVDYDGTTIDCHWTAEVQWPPTGYSDYFSDYSSAYNVNHNLPYTVTGNKSVLSSISWLEGDSGTYYTPTRTRPALKRIAILTVLSEAPPANSMRPSFAAGQKTLYSAADINEALLPNLTPPASAPSMSAALADIQGPRVDLSFEYGSEFLRPSDNYNRAYPSTTYQAYVVPQYTMALLLALTDESVVGDKTELVIRLVQAGIDYYGLLQNGATWPANGGHQLGYKLPILFAGLMLNHSGMLSVGSTYSATSDTFQEDCQHFIVDQARVDMTHSAAWDPDDRATMTPYEAADIGLPEWGIRGCSRFAEDNADVSATYRDTNAPPNMGQGLAAMILGLRDEWNHEPFFQYLDRWKTWKGTFSSTFEQDMWNSYRNNYPPIWRRTPRLFRNVRLHTEVEP